MSSTSSVPARPRLRLAARPTPRAGPHLTLALCLAALSGLASAPAPARAGGSVEPTGHDAVTAPGKPVLVRAKFEQGVLGRDLQRAKVELTFLGRTYTDLTDRDGFAEVSVTPPEAGVFPYEMRLVERPQAPPATGRVFVIAPSRPVAVVDVDGTISDQSLLTVPFTGADADTFVGAPELLRELARTYVVIYLTARDDQFERATRGFLARHEFPDGAVIYNELGLRDQKARGQLLPGNHGAFKLGVIQRMRELGLDVRVGIGNAETDAWAYEQAELKSYILTELAGTGPSFRFTRYADLRPRLLGDGVLPAETAEPGAEPAPSEPAPTPPAPVGPASSPPR